MDRVKKFAAGVRGYDKFTDDDEAGLEGRNIPLQAAGRDSTSEDPDGTGRGSLLPRADEEDGFIMDADYAHSHHHTHDHVADAHGMSITKDASASQTFFNLLKSYLGSGILGLPYAFRQSGLIAGIILMVGIASIATHGMLLLVQAKHKLASRGAVTYSDIAYFAYGRRMAVAVDALLCFTQFGFCVVYMVFVAENLAQYFPTLPEQEARANVLLFLLPLLIVMSWIRSLAYIGPVSLAANFAIVGGMIIVLIASFIQISQNVVEGAAWNIDWFIAWRTVPIMFGMSVYALEGIGVVLPSETAMKDSHRFPRVLSLVMMLSIINYVLMGCIPYIAFGKNVQDHLTENIAEFAEFSENPELWNALLNVVRLLFVFAIASSYPVQMYVFLDIVENEMFKPGRISPYMKFWKQNLFRAFSVCVAVLVALSLPKFGLLMGFIGAVGGTSLQFIFPPLFYLRVCGATATSTTKALCRFYISVGVLGGLLGVIQTTVEMISGDG
eukprot:Clim_evm9s85 gene=Clim_evmTU9s85